MTLTQKQQGVLLGMAVGLTSAVALIVIGGTINPFGFSTAMDLPSRMSIAIESSVMLAIFLVASEDIDAGAAQGGSDRAKILQSLLQNTLEQTVIAIMVYMAWAATMPAQWLSVVPMAAILFSLGRALFFVGYEKGAPYRALGFALGFYSSVGMLICVIGHVLHRFFTA
jgi:uncharacterized MAPEG superfamily protein